MISTQIDLKAISGDIRKLRAALGKTAEFQGRELASSIGYVAARHSFPIEPSGKNGGGKLGAKPEKKQNFLVRNAISAYTLGSRKDQNETLSSLEKKHPKRVRRGGRIISAKQISRLSDTQKSFASRADTTSLTIKIQQRIGWNKAAFVAAAIMVNPVTKARIPVYIKRHLASAKGKAAIQKGSDGEYLFTLTNYSNQAGSLLDSGSFRSAFLAATKGQIMRYEAQIRKAIKEARLAQ